MSANSWVIEK